MPVPNRIEPKRLTLEVKPLAPPVATILLYAADGLAVLKGDCSASGRPKTPGPEMWAPAFFDLINEAEGMDKLQSLAETGMKAWGLAGDYLGCLRAAFDDITFRARALAEIEEYGFVAPKRPTAKLALVAMPGKVQSSTPTR